MLWGALRQTPPPGAGGRRWGAKDRLCSQSLSYASPSAHPNFLVPGFSSPHNQLVLVVGEPNGDHSGDRDILLVLECSVPVLSHPHLYWPQSLPWQWVRFSLLYPWGHSSRPFSITGEAEERQRDLTEDPWPLLSFRLRNGVQADAEVPR